MGAAPMMVAAAPPGSPGAQWGLIDGSPSAESGTSWPRQSAAKDPRAAGADAPGGHRGGGRPRCGQSWACAMAAPLLSTWGGAHRQKNDIWNGSLDGDVVRGRTGRGPIPFTLQVVNGCLNGSNPCPAESVPASDRFGGIS